MPLLPFITLDLSGFFGLIVWVVYTLSLLWCAWLVSARYLADGRPTQRLLLTLLLAFAVQAVTVYLLGIPKLLHPASFAGLAVLYAGIGWLMQRRAHHRLVSDLQLALRQFLDPLPAAMRLLLLAALSACCVTAILPTEEWDTLSFLLPAIAGAVTQHALPAVGVDTFAYPKFWEFQSVPSLVLLHSDGLLWVPGLLANAAMALVIYELARALGLSRRTGAVLGWIALSYFLFLWRMFGMASAKDDVIHNIALLVIILVVMRVVAYREAQQATGMVLLATSAFVMLLGTKLTGIVYAVALAPAWILGFWALRRHLPWPAISLGAFSPYLLAGLAVLPYFLTKYLHHGSPLYPFPLHIGNITLLHGPATVEGTRIIEYIGDPQMWLQFLLRGMKLAGPEFPLILGIGLLAPVILLCELRRRTLSPADQSWMIVGLYAALGWLLYFNMFWTYGDNAGAPVYLGHSLRFALGTLLLSTLFAVAWLARRRWPWLLGVLGMRDRQWSARTWVILGMLMGFHALFLGWVWWKLGTAGAWGVLAGVGLVSGALFVEICILLRRPARSAGRLRLTQVASLLILACIFMILFRDSARPAMWCLDSQAVWQTVWLRFPQGNTILSFDAGRDHFPLLGPHLGNRLVKVETPLEIPAQASAGIDLIYLETHTWPPETIDAVTASLRAQGWQVVAQGNKGRLLAQ
jgi:hypothetical protein